MTLEYLDDVADGGRYRQAAPDRLIRLYDFNEVELTNFKEKIKDNLIEKGGELIISQLAYVVPLNCSLTFRVSEHDLGVKFFLVNEYAFSCD